MNDKQDLIYAREIKGLVDCAITDLEAAHASGKLSNTPVSNTHYIVRWIATSIKTQRFPTIVAKDLIRWQKMGRSKGTATELHSQFKIISKLYSEHFVDGNYQAPVIDKTIDQFLDHMESIEWSVSTEFELLEKNQLFTEGESSLVLCAGQCDSCFDGGEELVKPISLFVRGNHTQFIEEANKFGFLMHKRSDYKSKVKYHGEYLLYPCNLGNQLAEIPFSYFKA
jgi:hypothetical protein